MPEVSLQIPAIGEGLQEARVVALLKQPGDTVKRDEIIYQMETDKAVMDVESPHEGKVVRWLAKEDDVLAIGAPVMIMDVSDGAPATPESKAESTQEPANRSGKKIVPLKIPAIGEGLQEARLVAKLKEVGDTVNRDETIYQMETDKAVMDVESPYQGKVVSWLAEVDEVLAIGADVLQIETEDDVVGESVELAAPVASSQAAPVASKQVAVGERRRDIPPRTRAYAKQKGLTEEQLNSIPAKGSKLMPEEIDAFLAGGATSKVSSKPATGSKPYSESPVPSKQRILASRLVRGNQLVVPGMMQVTCDWSEIEALREESKAAGGDFQPSTFTYFAYAVAKACADHPIVRSTLAGDDTIRTYENVQLGIAVSLPGDELVVAVVEDADSLSWKDFATQARAKINLAREGKDQANESVTLSITNMQGYGIRDAMAVVVPPGVATIFLGEAYNGLAQNTTELKVQRCANIGITIDHRIINGVGGAEFLNAIKTNVENIRSLISQ